MKATEIYRDNFVYNINTPLCPAHAQQVRAEGLSQYGYLEKCTECLECDQCEEETRLKALQANLIHWSLFVDGSLVFESKDRSEFFNYIRSSKPGNYEIKQAY